MSDQWCQFKEKMKMKRGGRCVRKGSSAPVKGKELTIQRLSSEVGRGQKYTKLGPREFVPFEREDTGQPQEMTIESIKAACEKHFECKNKVCDVLAGERGPSCKTVDQIPDYKVIHVRFVELCESESGVPGPLHSTNQSLKRKSSNGNSSTPDILTESLPGAPKTRHVNRGNVPVHTATSSDTTASPGGPTSTYVPRSLSVIDMLKLGKIKDKCLSSSIIDIHTFDMDICSWSKLTNKVEFYEEKEPFGAGGFRKAYKATSKHSMFQNSQWVIKRYHPEAVDGILATEQTVEDHTRKVVQMHLLARNFASQLAKKVDEENQGEIFGRTLTFRNIFLGKTDSNECVTVEEYVDGKFCKYLNNTGLRCMEECELTQKAECLAHYSFEKSQHKLLLVDIQGSEYSCFDPEIASADLYDDNEMLYCTGNLSTLAISNFKGQHKCSVYCSLLGLPEMSNS